MSKESHENRRNAEQFLLRMVKQQKDRITPEQVVLAAEDPDSPLHYLFEWDDTRAAHQHRLDQARTFIRSVKVRYITETKTVTAVALVRDPEADAAEAGYISVSKVKKDTDLARDVLLMEFDRAAAALNRARRLAAVFDMQDTLDTLISEVQHARSQIPSGQDPLPS